MSVNVNIRVSSLLQRTQATFGYLRDDHDLSTYIWKALAYADTQQYPYKFQTFKAIIDKSYWNISYDIMKSIRLEIQKWDRSALIPGSNLHHHYQPNIDSFPNFCLSLPSAHLSPPAPLSLASSSSSGSLFGAISGALAIFTHKPVVTSSPGVSTSSPGVSSSSQQIVITQPLPPIEFPLSTATQFLNFIPSTFKENTHPSTKVEVSKPPQMTSTDYVYDEPDLKLDRHKCPICIHVATNMVSASCCGQVYCLDCFNKLTSFPSKPLFRICSVCKSQGAIVRTPNGFKDYFDELSIKCNVCQISHPRGHFNQHWLNECKNPCTHQCGAFLLRADAPTHMHECPNIKIQCPSLGCDQSHLRKDAVDHSKECKYQLLTGLTTHQIMQLAIKQLTDNHL